MTVAGTTARHPIDGSRELNRARLLGLILAEPRVDRTRLAESTGLTNAAVTRIVQELMGVDLVRDVGALDSGKGRGRRRIGLEVNPRGGYVLGVSILAFNSSVALADLTGKIVAMKRIEPENVRDPGRTLDELCGAALSLVEGHGVDPSRILGAGVAVAGYLHPETRALESAPYLGWPPFDLGSSVERRLRMPVAVENVNRCIAVAESRFGGCAGVRDLVLIRAAIGLGGATISAGEIARGHRDKAGQTGHVPVDPDGMICSCGARGCLNTLASGWSVLNRLGLSDDAAADRGTIESQENKLKRVLAQAASGDRQANEAIAEAGGMLARHCAGLLHFLDPEVVVVTGPLGRDRSYVGAFRDTLDRFRVQARIVASLESEIVSPGAAAAALALSTHVYSPSFDLRALMASGEGAMSEVDRIELL